MSTLVPTWLAEGRLVEDATERAALDRIRLLVWDDGRPVRDFRGLWDATLERAGLPRRIPHDCRRTAARNLSGAGVPERVTMALCDWKTRSMFDRYRWGTVERSETFQPASATLASH
jgi:integrase